MDPGFHEVCVPCEGRLLCAARGLNYCVAHQGLYPQLDIRCEYVERLIPGLHQTAGDQFLRQVPLWDAQRSYYLVDGFNPVLSLATRSRIVFGACRACVSMWAVMMAKDRYYG